MAMYKKKECYQESICIEIFIHEAVSGHCILKNKRIVKIPFRGLGGLSSIAAICARSMIFVQAVTIDRHAD